MAINTLAYIENYLKIVDKKSQLIPFRLNKPQLRLYEAIKEQVKLGNPVRVIVLKARQMGFSTFIEGVGVKDVSTQQNRRMAIVTHKDEATRNLYRMTRRYYDNLIPELQPKTKSYNGYGIEYEDLKSSIVLYTAGGTGIGRSDTIHFLHCSEVAFWPGNKEETLNGLLQAVPNEEDTYVFLESTANGFDYFKDIWDGAVDGTNGYIAFFAAWFEDDGYVADATDFVLNQNIGLYGDEKEIMDLYDLTLEQMAWRRNKIKEPGNSLEKFKQEFPCNPLEAFIASGDSIFNNERVISRIEHVKKHIKPLKQGRFNYETYVDADGIIRVKDETIKWEDNPKGEILIYEEPEVKKEDRKTLRAPYVIGGDTAGTGEDYFTAKVINNITKADAAIYRKQKEDEGVYSEQIYCLHKYYHDALVGIETNYSIYPTRRLMELQVRQYSRENLDTTAKVILDQLGFKTTNITRPNMISSFKDTIRETMDIIKDLVTLQEMLTFIRDKNGKAQAEEGKHDDMIMATMIAHKISYQQSASYMVHEEEKIDIIEQFFGKKHNDTEGGIDEW